MQEANKSELVISNQERVLILSDFLFEYHNFSVYGFSQFVGVAQVQLLVIGKAICLWLDPREKLTSILVS